MNKPRLPTSNEAHTLLAGGFRVGEPGWWLVPGCDPITTDEALSYVQAVRDAAPGDPRAGVAGVRTTEFWLTLGVVLPVVAAGITAMTTSLAALPPPWNLVAGGVLTGIGAGTSLLYLRARSELKRRGLDSPGE